MRQSTISYSSLDLHMFTELLVLLIPSFLQAQSFHRSFLAVVSCTAQKSPCPRGVALIPGQIPTNEQSMSICTRRHYFKWFLIPLMPEELNADIQVTSSPGHHTQGGWKDWWRNTERKGSLRLRFLYGEELNQWSKCKIQPKRESRFLKRTI